MAVVKPGGSSRIWKLVRGPLALVGALVITLLVFLVLPLLQTLGDPLRRTMLVRSVDLARQPPPPPPPVQEEEQEEEPPEPPPPDLTPDLEPLDLSQLELALNPGGFGEESFGSLAVDLGAQLAGNDGGADEIFSLADLDQQPRLLFQKPPTYPPDLYRARREGVVYVRFVVEADGRVGQARVRTSSDPAFERAALEAVRQWRFEPGTRNGQAVSFHMEQPIIFKHPG